MKWLQGFQYHPRSSVQSVCEISKIDLKIGCATFQVKFTFLFIFCDRYNKRTRNVIVSLRLLCFVLSKSELAFEINILQHQGRRKFHFIRKNIFHSIPETNSSEFCWWHSTFPPTQSPISMKKLPVTNPDHLVSYPKVQHL